MIHDGGVIIYDSGVIHIDSDQFIESDQILMEETSNTKCPKFGVFIVKISSKNLAQPWNRWGYQDDYVWGREVDESTHTYTTEGLAREDYAAQNTPPLINADEQPIKLTDVSSLDLTRAIILYSYVSRNASAEELDFHATYCREILSLELNRRTPPFRNLTSIKSILSSFTNP